MVTFARHRKLFATASAASRCISRCSMWSCSINCLTRTRKNPPFSLSRELLPLRAGWPPLGSCA